MSMSVIYGGYTNGLPNFFIDANYGKPYKILILNVIFRKTKGFHKNFYHISYNDFRKITGFGKPKIISTLKELLNDGQIIKMQSTPQKISYGINFNFKPETNSNLEYQQDIDIEHQDGNLENFDGNSRNNIKYKRKIETKNIKTKMIYVDEFSDLHKKNTKSTGELENFAKKYLGAYFENNTAAQKFSSPKYELEVLNYLKSNKNYFLTNNALAMKALSNYFNYNSVSDTYPMSPKNFLEIHKQYLDANNLPANCKIRTDVLTNMMREKEQENGGRKKDYYDYRFGERAEERRNENKIPTGNIEKDNYINSFKKDFKLILTDFYTKAKSNGIKKDDLHDYAVYNYNEDWIEEYWKDEPEKWEAWAQRSFGISWYLDNVKFRSMPVEMFIHYFCNAAYEAKGLRWR